MLWDAFVCIQFGAVLKQEDGVAFSPHPQIPPAQAFFQGAGGLAASDLEQSDTVVPGDCASSIRIPHTTKRRRAKASHAIIQPCAKPPPWVRPLFNHVSSVARVSPVAPSQLFSQRSPFSESPEGHILGAWVLVAAHQKKAETQKLQVASAKLCDGVDAAKFRCCTRFT